MNKYKDLRLDYCDECMQMTNHLNDECQKCIEKEKRKNDVEEEYEEEY